MTELPMTLLLIALTFLVLIISCFIVGWSMYQLGLHGRVFKMMKEQDTVPEKKAESEKVPDFIPGSQYDPFYSSHEPRWSHPSLNEDADVEREDEEDQYLDEDNLDESEFVEDPVIPSRVKHKVVMTGGYSD